MTLKGLSGAIDGREREVLCIMCKCNKHSQMQLNFVKRVPSDLARAFSCSPQIHTRTEMGKRTHEPAQFALVVAVLLAWVWCCAAQEPLQICSKKKFQQGSSLLSICGITSMTTGRQECAPRLAGSLAIFLKHEDSLKDPERRPAEWKALHEDMADFFADDIKVANEWLKNVSLQQQEHQKELQEQQDAPVREVRDVLAGISRLQQNRKGKDLDFSKAMTGGEEPSDGQDEDVAMNLGASIPGPKGGRLPVRLSL